MTLIIYGFRLSTCTRRVALICKEIGLDYELKEVDITKGQQSSEAHVQKQPFRQVPVISDDGFEMFESRAICRYLVLKYGKPGPGGLLPDPTDLQAVAKFEQAASIENNNFDPAASQIAVESVFKPFRGLTADAERLKKYTDILNAKLDAYDVILGKQKYLAGDTVTIADLFHLPYGATIQAGGYEGLTTRPNVARWWKDISSRKSWEAVKGGA